MQRSGSDGSTHPGYRGDIEGLRAVAVLLVILSHLVAWPAGGFIGVDVFFVVSGFLITGLLLDETERNGRLSFRGFYARRARRILPAALTVLAAIVVVAHLMFRGTRVTQTVTDVKWALGFSANIHFAQVGTDYFAANRAPSLVQHFWSLAVEEQFYLVWPVVILLVLTTARRWIAQRTSRMVLLAVITAGSAASFGFALIQTGNDPTAAYFSSPGRAWELGAGALVAVGARTFPAATMWCGRFPTAVTRLGRIRGPVSLLALTTIVVSAFVVPSSPGFPAPWAALPVLATVAVVVAGARGMWGFALTNPVSRYVGRISYSLYLWHWPVILVVAALVRDPSFSYPIAIIAMTGLSIASYHLVEAPIRTLRRNRPIWHRPRAGWIAGAARPAVAVLACLVTVLLLAVLIPPRHAPVFTTAATAAPAKIARTGPELADPGRPLAHAIDVSLSPATTSFPDVNPPLDHLDTARLHWGACNGATEQNLTECTFGSRAPDTRVAVVIGDSIAMSWLPGVEAALAGSGWRIYGLTLEACPAADVPVVDTNHHPDAACDARHRWVKREANRLNPQLVILASTESTLGRLRDRPTGARAAAEYRAGLQRMIRALHPSPQRHVLTLSPPPKSPALMVCDVAGSTPADCVSPVSGQWISFAATEKAAATATHTSYSDTHLWFCNRAGFCPAFIGSTVVTWDGQHLTDVYARSLATQLRSVVRSALSR